MLTLILDCEKFILLLVDHPANDAQLMKIAESLSEQVTGTYVNLPMSPKELATSPHIRKAEKIMWMGQGHRGHPSLILRCIPGLEGSVYVKI